MALYNKTATTEVDEDPGNQAVVIGKSPGQPATCRVILGQLEHAGTLASLLPLPGDRAQLAALLVKVRVHALAALGYTVKP
jgi:hypothetical protein